MSILSFISFQSCLSCLTGWLLPLLYSNLEGGERHDKNPIIPTFNRQTTKKKTQRETLCRQADHARTVCEACRFEQQNPPIRSTPRSFPFPSNKTPLATRHRNTHNSIVIVSDIGSRTTFSAQADNHPPSQQAKENTPRTLEKTTIWHQGPIQQLQSAAAEKPNSADLVSFASRLLHGQPDRSISIYTSSPSPHPPEPLEKSPHDDSSPSSKSSSPLTLPAWLSPTASS